MAVGLSLAGVTPFVFQNNLKERLLANLEPVRIAIQHGSKEQAQKLLPRCFLCSCSACIPPGRRVLPFDSLPP